MASEIRVNKLNSQTGVGTITLSPTGVDISGITITDVSGEDAGVQAIAGAVFDATCLEAYRLNQVGVRSESNS